MAKFCHIIFLELPDMHLLRNNIQIGCAVVLRRLRYDNFSTGKVELYLRCFNRMSTEELKNEVGDLLQGHILEFANPILVHNVVHSTLHICFLAEAGKFSEHTIAECCVGNCHHNVILLMFFKYFGYKYYNINI